jgi:hypothetical protein
VEKGEIVNKGTVSKARVIRRLQLEISRMQYNLIYDSSLSPLSRGRIESAVNRRLDAIQGVLDYPGDEVSKPQIRKMFGISSH